MWFFKIFLKVYLCVFHSSARSPHMLPGMGEMYAPVSRGRKGDMKGHPLHAPQFSIRASFAWQPNEVQHCNISIIWLRSAQTSDFLPMWKGCSEIPKGLLKDLTVSLHRFTNFMLKVGNIRSKCNSFRKRMKLTSNYVTLPWFCHLSYAQ